MRLRRRYEKAQKPLGAFEADIRRYADLTDEVLAESAHEPIKFLLVDCGPLKQVLFVMSLRQNMQSGAPRVMGKPCGWAVFAGAGHMGHCMAWSPAFQQHWYSKRALEICLDVYNGSRMLATTRQHPPCA